MSSDDDSSRNPFIRFKNQVDSSLSRGVQTVFPSGQAPETARPAGTTGTGNGTGPDREYATIEDVYTWAAHSPYSPLNLQHLPQPIPRDVPPESPSSFTFRDAFEDLLSVSSGRGFSDRRHWAGLGPSGGAIVDSILDDFGFDGFLPPGTRTLPVEDWVERLGEDGLWSSYFRLSPFADRWFRQDLLFRGDNFNFRQRPLSWKYGGPGAAQDGRKIDAHKLWLQAMGADAPASPHATSSPHADRERAETRYPETEQDQYAFEQYRVASEKMKQPTPAARLGLESSSGGVLRTAAADRSSDPPEESVSFTTKTADGGRMVQTMWRNNNEPGKERAKLVTEHYGSDGTLLSRQTEATTTSSSGPVDLLPGLQASWSWSRSSSNSSRQGPAEVGDGGASDAMPREQKGGSSWSDWLWTRRP
ncbi:hypothetical protein GGR56DRAFT_628517 [Xylariaceae sp. FL0804]|nr:hypothetical protein GGR56DRAFT_628517 [Xylariaceae sp. FL0804]